MMTKVFVHSLYALILLLLPYALRAMDPEDRKELLYAIKEYQESELFAIEIEEEHYEKVFLKDCLSYAVLKAMLPLYSPQESIYQRCSLKVEALKLLMLRPSLQSIIDGYTRKLEERLKEIEEQHALRDEFSTLEITADVEDPNSLKLPQEDKQDLDWVTTFENTCIENYRS